MNIISPLDSNEVTIYHESGHAVMARLFGRRVHQVNFAVNVDETYNGYTHWGRDELMREWDPNIPYKELGLEQAESKNGVALVIAAGKATERVLYRKRHLDESLASFGSGGGNFNDERELEDELLYLYPNLKQEELAQAKQVTEDLAMRLLESKVCWQAVDTIAQVLLARLDHGSNPNKDIQQIITNAFERAVLNENG